MNKRFRIGLVPFVLLSMTIGFSLTNITASRAAPNHAQEHTVWKLYSSDGSMARRGMAAVYDTQRQVVVMFGGVNAQDNLDNATWEFDGTNWHHITPVHFPPARFWHGMAYDSQRHVVVLFGGNDGQGNSLNDTWEYNGVDWVQVTTIHSPSQRQGFGMTYDSCRQKLVLFGGGEIPKGTWEYNGTDWQKISVSNSPGGLFMTALTFDSTRCRVVLFGGDGGEATGKNETWEYDGVNWALISTVIAPIPRWGHSMAFDPGRGKTILFGGYGPEYPTGTPLGDTWEYDGANWTETSPAVSPAANEQQMMVYKAGLKKILLFGGFGSGETWLYGEVYSIFLPLVVR